MESDLLVVNFPLWWFGMPAILKGWIDRVFVYGRLYQRFMRYDNGICAGKKVIACVTTGAGEDACSQSGRERDTLLHLWPILFPFRYLGFDVLQPEVFHSIGGVAFIEGHEEGPATIEAYTKQWQQTLETVSSRPVVRYNHDEDFDSSNRLVSGAPVYSPFVRQKR